MASRTDRVIIRHADGTEYSVTEHDFYTYKPHTEETDPEQANKTYGELGFKITSWANGVRYVRSRDDEPAPRAESKSESKG